MACPGDLPPIKPQTTLIPTQIFGIPRGVMGRTVANVPFTIQGIVIHCLDETLSAYDNRLACATPQTIAPNERHASVHYAVGNMGAIHQYVDDDNISWGFRPYLDNSYITPPAALSAITWEPLNGNNNGASPDHYAINIGLEGGLPIPANGCFTCPTATVLQQAGYDNLIHLLAWIAHTYSVPIDIEHIQFHENIECAIGEECRGCDNINQILTDVLAYCEPCEDEAPNLPIETCPDNVQDFRARTNQNCCDDNGCEVYVPLDACFLGSLVNPTTDPAGTLPNGILGLENVTGALCPTGDDVCIVSGCVAVESPLSGCGTTADPIVIDPCVWGDFLPDGIVVNVIGIDAGGCLVEQPCIDFVPQCETPLTCNDTTNIDITCSGVSNHTIQASIIFDPNPNNLAEDIGNGLLVLFECSDLAALFAPGTVANFYGNDGAGACVTQDAATLVTDIICTLPVDLGDTPTYILGRDMTDCPEFFTPIQVVAAGFFPVDTNCIDITYNTLTGDFSIEPIIDPSPDNILVCGASGLLVDFEIVDGNCIDLTWAAGSLSAELIISPDANNILECRINGAYVGFSVTDTNCIDLTFAAGVLTADPIISPGIAGVNNALICDATGLFVPQGANVAVNGPITGTGTNLDPLDVDFTLLTLQDRCDIGANLPLGTLVNVVGLDGSDCLIYNTLANVIENGLVVNDTNCVDLTLTGNVLTADIIIPPSFGGVVNILQCTASGLFVPQSGGITVLDTDCIDLDLTTGTLQANIIFAPPQAGVLNIASCIAGQGLYVPVAAGLTISDTNCIDLTLTASGQLSADIIIAPAQAGIDNAIQCIAGQGLYAPEVPPVDPDACNGLEIRPNGLFVNNDFFVFDSKLGLSTTILASDPPGQGLPAVQTLVEPPVFLLITNPSDCNEMHCDINIENQQLNIGNTQAVLAASVSMTLEYTVTGGAVWLGVAGLNTTTLLQVGDFEEPNTIARLDSIIIPPGGSFTFGLRRFVWNPDANFLGFATIDGIIARLTCIGLTP